MGGGVIAEGLWGEGEESRKGGEGGEWGGWGGEGVMPAAARVMSSLPRERTCMNVMLGVNV